MENNGNHEATPQTYCGKTLDEIRAMRMQHGHLIIVDVTDEGKTYHAICKEPTLQIMDMAGAISKTSEAKGSMALYDNCVVLADEAIKQRDMLKVQVAAAIGKKVGALRSSAKNV